ncbi:MAG: TraR/DksA C4-type zinc finger protein [Burkholderiales bacterium]|nr:TraR/DksA C4-type zinc finger protein [Burkholderiales bacterium]
MPLTADQIEQLKRILEERRRALFAETLEDMARAREETFSAVAGAVRDSGDEAQADLIADLDQAEVAREVREIRDIEAAQARLAAGTYGVCSDCGADIAFERLMAYPTAKRCHDCQRVYEKTHAHPPESKL